jgi:predicted HAD superfamily hydrolase
MTLIHSFDVFDTLLTRPLLRPSSLFHIVGARLAGEGAGHFTAAQFHAARYRAERRARQAARPRDDCRFDEIYAHFPELPAWGVTPGTAMAVELESERAAIRPIAATVAEIRALASRGETVVFISDMYLPTEFIRNLLHAHVLPVA